MKRIFVVVLDSVGIGEMPDAAKYGDEGSNTLRSASKSPEYDLKNMIAQGLYNIQGVDWAEPVPDPAGAFGKMQECSAGKDTTSGHWEIAGLISETAMPTFPEGFPPELLQQLEEASGRGILCNKPYSGTEVIKDYGMEHMETGKLIVYTSADSVLQIAAHEEVVPLEELYAICHCAREICQGEWGVGRIIARPFVGTCPEDFTRTTNRHDYSLEPTGPTMLDVLKEEGFDVIGVGKIHDIFAARGLTEFVYTAGNTDGIAKTLDYMRKEFNGLCFVNLVDTDSLYGHRNDVDGYARALTEFDRALPEMLSLLNEEDLLFITADHGCDPETPSTDHSREYVPLLVCGQRVAAGTDLGIRGTFGDVSATILDEFGVENTLCGTSFKKEIIHED